MAVKCIGIGNRIMGDDGIGIRVVEQLLKQLRDICIEVILGETDIDYAISKIDNGDFLFIIDAAYFNEEPGTVTFISIDKYIKQHTQAYSQHQSSLVHLIKVYKKSVKGFIIGIEVHEIDFSLELSNTLQTRLPHICEEVYQFIYKNTRRV
ncbi:hydrogenase maturation protease [Serpentinicella alkaliphila]|uniref:Hydrogenase maturation protease n=1 Tax=Serpentinicella alkaliphila TaxID=1734049 RepID=A0A4R2TMM5_9FIRM|nr:hydrogenase maturation protease [Serpentinicella alkaliphila]QUH26398.1 hydrogenase maturation protease [Serpentinicella alkaliphila]TCP96172.1 hydrogenase maturation protease [Serpentinicella alkaliphila]